VLETEEDQKNYLWVTLGMIAAAVLLLVGFFVFKDRLTSKEQIAVGEPAAGDGASAPMQPRGALLAAAKKLSDSNGAALDAFRGLASDAKQPAGERVWASLLSGGLLIAQGAGAEAQKTFGEARATAETLEHGPEHDFLREMANAMASGESPTPEQCANYNRLNHEAGALLLHGLNHWREGRVEEGAALLRQFRSARPEGDAAWLQELLPLANEMIEKRQRFQALAAKFAAAKTISGRAEEAEALRAAGPEFRSMAEKVIAPHVKEIDDFLVKSKQPPEAAIYRVHTKVASRALDFAKFHLEDGGALQVSGGAGTSNQIWEFVPGDGGYEIVALHSGKALEVPGGKPDEGLPIRQAKRNGSSAQKWEIFPQGKAWYKVKSVASGKWLTLKDGRLDHGVAVVQSGGDHGDRQLWFFTEVGKRQGDYFIRDFGPESFSRFEGKNGEWTIVNRSHDLWDVEDSFGYAFRAVWGDFDAVVHVAAMENAPHEWTKAGLCFRMSLNVGARNVAVVVGQLADVSHQRRNADKQQTTSTKIPGQPVPRWLKLSRRGEKFTSYHSADGSSWTRIHEEQQPGIGGHGFIGMAVTSHHPAKEATFVLKSFSVTKPQ
jgi:hypothetical protein